MQDSSFVEDVHTGSSPSGGVEGLNRFRECEDCESKLASSSSERASSETNAERLRLLVGATSKEWRAAFVRKSRVNRGKLTFIDLICLTCIIGNEDQIVLLHCQVEYKFVDG